MKSCCFVVLFHNQKVLYLSSQFHQFPGSDRHYYNPLHYMSVALCLSSKNTWCHAVEFQFSKINNFIWFDFSDKIFWGSSGMCVSILHNMHVTHGFVNEWMNSLKIKFYIKISMKKFTFSHWHKKYWHFVSK